MRFITISMLMLFSQISSAHTLYSRISECTPKLDINGKEFQATVNVKRGASDKEQIDQARKKIFNIIENQLENYPNGLIEQSVLFKKNRQTQQITAIVSAKQVENCQGETHKITSNNLELLTAIVKENAFPAIKLSTEYTFTPELPEEIKPIEFDGSITNKSAFGVPLGASYEEAVNSLGRFTLYWPINNRLSIALIGRNHLFMFENNVFIGYQFHNNLLPMSLANQLELVGMDFQLTAANKVINSKDYLSENEKRVLEKSYAKVSFQSMHHDNETSFSKIESIQIGKLHEINKSKTLPCYNSNNSFNQFLTQNKLSLVSFIDVDEKKSLLSGCLQKFTLSGNGKLREVNLLDEIGSADKNSQTISALVKTLKPWTLDQVKYGQSASELLALGAKLEWQQALLETPKWHGIFEIYDDVIYSGKVIPLALD